MGGEVEAGRGGRPGVERGARRRRFAALRSNPDLAAVLAILVPGAGHLYLGRFRAGMGWLVAILVGYWAVFFPGLFLHAASILVAYRAARSRRIAADGLVPGGA